MFVLGQVVSREKILLKLISTGCHKFVYRNRENGKRYRVRLNGGKVAEFGVQSYAV